eukprot:1159940-Pelagomonas_calceolata.AAC.2
MAEVWIHNSLSSVRTCTWASCMEEACMEEARLQVRVLTKDVNAAVHVHACPKPVVSMEGAYSEH